MIRVTGIGVVSALGRDVADLGCKRALMAATGAFAYSEIGETPFFQGTLEEDEVRDGFALGLDAAWAALDDAEISPAEVPVSLVLATGAGDTRALEADTEAPARPYDLARQMADAMGLTGVVLTVATACSSSSYAASLARDLLAQGAGHVLLCGVESKSDSSQYTFKSLMALDPAGCFPFTERRNGTVLGAGAAALLLTDTPQGNKRTYARLSGISLTCDGYHDTAPEPEGRAVRRGVDQALAQGGHQHAEIDLFVPHATGTKLNDAIEARLLDTLFGDDARGRMVLLKGDIGHTCGASSAFSMAVAAKALHEGGARAALIGASAFGGNNAAVVMSRAEGAI